MVLVLATPSTALIMFSTSRRLSGFSVTTFRRMSWSPRARSYEIYGGL